jgi:hypothetical protein
MFRSAKALDRAKTHASFRQAMAAYGKTTESWYDGSVDAVDRRIAHVDKLLHHIRATVARMDFADSATQLREAQSLSADRSALVEFKRTLLTGAADYSTWRHAGEEEGGVGPLPERDVNPYDPKYSPKSHPPPPWEKREQELKRTSTVDSLPPSDRRWVTLESSRFVSANTDCLSDPEELATRAGHHAALKTSTFSRPHSAAVTRAFVSAVVELGEKNYRPSTVKTAAIDIGFEPESMFL